MINRFLSILLLMFLSISGFADDNTSEMKRGLLKGFVFDQNEKQPLEYATISVIKKKDGTISNGTITDKTGFFKIKDMDFGMFQVKVSFIGYKSKTIDKVMIRPDDNEIDLGQIMLEPNVEALQEAVIVADRPTLTYKIDKKIINVSQQHTSASGTAVEILENIPSITVDIEGNVSLRGSESFTVLIDNKPTVLEPSDALSQIPASAIENIEVITNPSAKYDPEGTSGIVNIITKKNILQGFNGIVNMNVGMYERYGGDFLLNWRKERMNIFIGADFNNRNMKGTKDTENRTIYNDTTSYILSNGDFTRGRQSYSVRGGFDLTLNPRNSINFEAQIGDHDHIRSSFTNYEEYTSPTTSNKVYTSDENSVRGGIYYNLNLSYTKKFQRKGHELYTLINYRSRESEEETYNKLFDNTGLLTSGQRSFESGPSDSYKVQVDYTLPLHEDNKFEAGYNASIDLSDDLTEMHQYNTVTQDYDFMPEYEHNVSHEKNIQAIYTMYSGSIGNFGYQGGIRGEYTYRDITLNETGESFVIDRFDLFPTVHVSYSTAKENQWMANYSRRIHRPRGWNLEPFLTWTDAYNVRIGNPDLIPEYIDSYELSHLIKFGRNSFSVDAYYRVTNNKIERTRSVYEENIFLSSFENVGKDYSLGIELMLGLDIQKWWHVDLMGNIYDYRVEGELLGRDFSENSFNWNTRFNNTFRLGKTTRIQLNSMYNSPTVTAQGERNGFFMTNLAVRQNFFNNKLAATLQVRDLLGTMSHSSTYEDVDFYSYYNFQPNMPLVTFTLTYKINNFKQDRSRRSQNNMDDMGEDEGF